MSKKKPVHSPHTPPRSTTMDEEQTPLPESTRGSPQQSTSPTGSLLSLSLAVVVPNEIDALYQDFRSWTGIPAWMVAEATLFGHILAAKGDNLLFKSKREGETAALFVGLARSLAILSFTPGGVPFGEQPFDALSLLTSWYGEEEARAFCRKALRPYSEAVVSTIAIRCWSKGDEATDYGTYDAFAWFEQAADAELLRLRAEHFQGNVTTVADQREGSSYDHALLAVLYEQAQWRVRISPSHTMEEDILASRRLLAARDHLQEITFQVEPKSAEEWIGLYRHALLTGERWLLPPDFEKKQRPRKRAEQP